MIGITRRALPLRYIEKGNRESRPEISPACHLTLG
jgi:hypothetical protein